MGIRRKKTMLEQAADYVEAAVETAREKAGPAIADAHRQGRADARGRQGQGRAGARRRQGQGRPALADAKAGRARSPRRRDRRRRPTSPPDGVAVATWRPRRPPSCKAEIKGEPKKKHRLRKLLLLSGVAALLGFVDKKLPVARSRRTTGSRRTPRPPPPADVGDPDADATDAADGDEPVGDEGGAAPDEAISDAAEEYHDVTTPDEPADVVELEPGEEPAEQPSPKS